VQGHRQVRPQVQEVALPRRRRRQRQHDPRADYDQRHPRHQLLRRPPPQELAAGQARVHQVHHGPRPEDLRHVSVPGLRGSLGAGGFVCATARAARRVLLLTA